MAAPFEVVRRPVIPAPVAPRRAWPLPPATARFAALVGYEILGGFRRRKVLAMVVIAAILVGIQVFLPPLLTGQAEDPDPRYAIGIGQGFGNDIFSSPFILFFAIAVAMDAVALDFENGSLATLLAKPVSRRMVFAAKFAGVVALLALVYAFLFTLTLAGAWLVYGPQEDLHLYPVLVAGALLSILVYATIVFTLGSVFKSSLIAAVGGFGTVFALIFLTFALVAAGQAQVVLGMPGPGPTGFVVEPGDPAPFGGFEGREVTPGEPPQEPPPPPRQINLGTHNLGPNLVAAVQDAGKEVVVVETNFGPPGTPLAIEEVVREPLGQAVARTIALAFVYIGALLGLAWWRFSRADVVG